MSPFETPRPATEEEIKAAGEFRRGGKAKDSTQSAVDLIKSGKVTTIPVSEEPLAKINSLRQTVYSKLKRDGIKVSTRLLRSKEKKVTGILFTPDPIEKS